MNESIVLPAPASGSCRAAVAEARPGKALASQPTPPEEL